MQIDEIVTTASSSFTVAKIGQVKWPVNVMFTDIGILKPSDDITPKEAVNLCLMIVCAQVGGHVDYKGFVEENNLERHFQLSNPPAEPDRGMTNPYRKPYTKPVTDVTYTEEE